MNSFFASWTSLADHDLAAGRVNQELADRYRLVVAAVAAAQDGHDPHPQLVVGEGTLDAVAHAGFDVAAAIHVAASREDDDRHARVAAFLDPVGFADLKRQVQARGVGQRRIEDRQITLLLFVRADPAVPRTPGP